MKVRSRSAGLALAIIAITGSLSSWPGCGAGPAFQEAQKAERKGDPQLAYEDYCKAGREHAGNGDVAEGIKRTGPATVASLQAQAQQAMQEGRHADAWRMLMRALEIRPNDKSLAETIRQLQEQHPTEVAEVRADWLKRGPAALALGSPASAVPATTTGPAASSERLALAGPRAVERPANPESRQPSEVSRPSPTGGQARRGQTDRSQSAGEAAADRPGSSESQRSHRQWAEAFAKTDKARGQKTEPEAGARPKPADAPPPAQPSAPRAAVQSETADTKPAPSAQPVPDFLVVRTLSKKDKRFPDELPLIDGVTVKLKGTDDDPKASFDLYDGKNRIKKCRGMRLGAAEVFRGRSGTAFRLSLLSIYDKTRTIRVGVRQDLSAIAP